MVWVFSSISNSSRMQIWSLSWQYGLVLCHFLTQINHTLTPIFTGYALGGTNLAENQLAPYIQQAKDQVCSLCNARRKVYSTMPQINFVIGDPAKSAPGEHGPPIASSECIPLLIPEHNKSCLACIPWTPCAVPFAVRRGWK